MARESDFKRLMRTRDNFLEEVTNYCLLGCTNEELANLFGLTKSQVDGWIHTSSNGQHIPVFADAVEEGRQRADTRVARAMLKRATGYEYESQRLVITKGHGEVLTLIEHVPPDTPAGKFWLTNRSANWREKQTTELTGRDGGAIETELTVKFIAPTRPETITQIPIPANEPALIEQCDD